jgi:multidrug efflux system outer membrane protein
MRWRGDVVFLVSVLPVLVALAGCSVGPKYDPPQISLGEKFSEGGVSARGDTTLERWWAAFGDSRLDQLVAQGAAQNLDTLQAIERINAARMNVVAAGAGGLPLLTLSGDSTVARLKSSDDFDSYREHSTQAGIEGSLLLDLFGRYKRARESAVAGLDEAYAVADEARLTLLAQVVSAYIDLRFYQRRLAISRADLSSRREMLAMTRTLSDQGQGTRLDEAQAEGALNSVATQIPGIEVAMRRSSHRIATLLGLPASDLVTDLEKPASQPVASRPAEVGIPADMIRNRPDIRAAERRLAASVAEIGVAESQLYPSITLGGSITPNYTALSGGLDTRALSWSFGPALNLPILDGGRLKANVEIARSTAAESYLAWKSTVLKAMEEVENALAAVNRDARTIASAKAAARSYREAVTMAVRRYGQGENSLFEVLDVQRSLSSAEADLADAVRTAALNHVELNRAIGSGYLAEPVAKPPGEAEVAAVYR